MGVQRYCDETETHLFRIAQEAFTNIARHSRATAVVVRLTATASTSLLSIEDNGRGMPEDRPDGSKPPTLGMVGMRARARQCGGEFIVTQVQPNGHRIEVEVPVRFPPPESAP